MRRGNFVVRLFDIENLAKAQSATADDTSLCGRSKHLAFVYTVFCSLVCIAGGIVKQQYQTSFSTAFSACQDALRDCHFFILSVDEEAGSIFAATKRSFWSWGEEVTVSIVVAADEVVDIVAKSTPKAQLFDWGKSSDNVKNFFTYLERRLGVTTVQNSFSAET